MPFYGEQALPFDKFIIADVKLIVKTVKNDLVIIHRASRKIKHFIISKFSFL